MKTGIVRCGFAPLTVTENSVTYGTPVYFVDTEAGTREYEAEPKGDVHAVWANSVLVYQGSKNSGYDIKLTLIDFIDDIAKLWYNDVSATMGQKSGIMSIVNFVLESIPTIIQAGIQLLTALVTALPDIITRIVAVLPEIINGIVNALTENLPTIIQAGIDLFVALINDLPAIIQTIMDAVPEIIDNVLTALTDSIPQLIDAGIALFIALVDNLPAILDGIVSAVPQIISSVIDATNKSIPKIIEAGIKLFVALIKDLPKIISAIVSKIPQIISSIISAFSSLNSKMMDVGRNMLEGLWNGISGAAGWLWDNVSGWASGLWNDICGFFGIHSPSTLFEKGLGKNMALGAGKGFVNTMQQVNKDMIKAIPTSFDVEPSMNIASLSRTAANLSNDVAAATQHLTFNLNIENFNNRSDKDMREIMDYAGRYWSSQIQRRDVVF